MNRSARLMLLAVLPLASAAADPAPATRPADAVVLFDGTAATEAANWTMRHTKAPAAWPVADGAMTSDKDDIVTNAKFHDFTLHVEFNEPVMGPEVKGQQRGNSGVYLQGRYEVQVLDSFGLKPTKGDCGAIYNQAPPTENACLPPGQWQAYDITYHAAVYDGEQRTAKPRATVVLNGKTVQDNVEINHVTGSELMKDGPADGPILLQFHHNGVHFRNVWIVPHA